MSNLVKTETAYSSIEISSISTLQKIDQKFILALVDSRISILEIQFAGNFLYETLKIIEIDSGLSKLENVDLIALSKSIYDLILDKYPALTSTEFRTACKNGVIGNYGEWYGMCLKSVNQWIKGYLSDTARIQAIKNWNKSIDESVIKISQKPVYFTKEYLAKSAKDAFEVYKETGKLPFVPHAIYDAIKELLKLDTLIDIKDWPQIQELSKKAYSESHKPKVGVNNITQVLNFELSNRSFEFEVKKQGLIFFFNNLISQKKSLEI